MKGILHNFNDKQNFWEIAGDLDMVPAFSAFKAADKTKNREHSSRIMWCIAYICDQSEANKYRNLPLEDKKLIMESDVLKAKRKVDWKIYEHLIEAYKELQLTANERALLVLKDKLAERSIFLNSTKYTVENAKDLDSIISNSDKIFKLISTLEKLTDEERKGQGELRGGRKKGLQEKGTF